MAWAPTCMRDETRVSEANVAEAPWEAPHIIRNTTVAPCTPQRVGERDDVFG